MEAIQQERIYYKEKLYFFLLERCWGTVDIGTVLVVAHFGANGFVWLGIVCWPSMTPDHANVRQASIRADLFAFRYRLEQCMTDDEGKVVHEDCYLIDILECST